MINSKLKKLLTIFILAFIFNAIWEHFHSNLYVHYQGGDITDLILLRAALFDASIITLVSWLTFGQKLYIPITILVLFAIGLGQFAMLTSRWAYNDLMPIIPLIQTGLTPTIQLGLTLWLSNKLSDYRLK